MKLLRRTLADIACAVLCVAAWLALLPLVAWRGVRGGWAEDSRATRALLLIDLALGELLGADRGETVSTWCARIRPARVACAFCTLLAQRWPTHCDDQLGVRFDLQRFRDRLPAR